MILGLKWNEISENKDIGTKLWQFLFFIYTGSIWNNFKRTDVCEGPLRVSPGFQISLSSGG
jgi:hypothetical protein